MGVAGRRVVLAEYFVTEEGTYFFGVTPESDDPDVVRLELTRADLRAAVARLTTTLRGRPSRVGEALDQPVLGDLVAPIARVAAPEDVVYVVPHDALHRLPWSALQVGGQLLAARNPVLLTPSASVLRYCRSRRGPEWRSALVVSGPPTDPPLVFAQAQASAVADLVPTMEVLAHRDASIHRLRERLAAGPAPDVLHFAAHGVFDPDEPLRSGIDLADGRLTAQDILGLSLEVDLVVLGSCESGVSDRRPGDELLGLTRSLLYAGAASALVSLWPVDELSTGFLFARFYAELLYGNSKVEALRRAQLWLRGLGAEAALALVQAMPTRIAGDPAAEHRLRLQEARLHALSGRVDTALAICAELVAMVVDDALRADVRLMAGWLRAGEPLLSERTGKELLFADPYFWASFVLVGDWS